jgi:PAS domain S-box-containing protein
VVTLLLVALAMVWAFVYYDSAVQRRRIAEHNGAERAALARTYAEHTRATLHRIDAVLLSLRQAWEFDRKNFDNALAEHQVHLSGVSLQVSVIGADGHLAYTNLGSPPGKVFLGDRPHFLAQANTAEDRLFVGAPVKGRVSNRWTVQLSRRLGGKNGFAGVMAASVDPEYFARFHAQSGLGSGTVVSILRGSGEFISRSSRMDEVLGKPGAALPFLAASAANAGFFEHDSVIDGVRRMAAWQRVPEFGITVMVAEEKAVLEARLAANDAARIGLGAALSMAWVALAGVLLWGVESRARAREVLESSEARFERFFRASPTAHVLTRVRDQKYAAINEPFEKLFETTGDQAIGRTSTELGFWVDPAARARFITSVRKAGRVDNFETMHRSAGGRQFAARQSSVIVNIGDEPHLLSTIVDISAEVALRDVGAQLGSIVGSAMDAIITCDEEGLVVVFNAAVVGLFGVTEDQARGHSVERFIPLASRGEHAQWMRRFSEEGTTNRAMGKPGTVLAVRQDGSTFPAEASISCGRTGGKLLFTVIMRDITARVAAERRIERLGRLYLALAKTNEAVVHAEDWKSLCQVVCRVIVEHGQVATAVIRMPDVTGSSLDLIAVHGAVGGIVGMKSIPLSEAGYPLVATLRDGQARIVADIAADPTMPISRLVAAEQGLHSAVLVPLLEGGHPIGTLSVVAPAVGQFDEEFVELLRELARNLVFARQKLDAARGLRESEERFRALNLELEARVAERTAALRDANHDLEATNRDLESFSYSVAHDLRSPLRSMAGFSQLLCMDLAEKSYDQIESHAQRITQSASRMSALIDGLLAVARVTHGALADASVDNAALVAEALKEATGSDKAQVNVGPLARVRGDIAALRQVWGNLISNAVKYSARRAHPQIDVGCMQDGQEVIFHVRDNGAGFDPAHAANLFGVFSRLHSASEFEGLGIGLAVVRRVVERHGGRVWAEGVPDAGATFYFALPAARVLGES